ncbi:MAG: hypothetical protein DRH23_08780 [Deltaproteobacteria bacterium]|nr:MAG: hypothetical protein DRH23_08780 [Deltaproteobacteria bacterium]
MKLLFGVSRHAQESGDDDERKEVRELLGKVELAIRWELVDELVGQRDDLAFVLLSDRIRSERRRGEPAPEHVIPARHRLKRRPANGLEHHLIDALGREPLAIPERLEQRLVPHDRVRGHVDEARLDDRPQLSTTGQGLVKRLTGELLGSEVKAFESRWHAHTRRAYTGCDSTTLATASA